MLDRKLIKPVSGEVRRSMMTTLWNGSMQRWMNPFETCRSHSSSQRIRKVVWIVELLGGIITTNLDDRVPLVSNEASLVYSCSSISAPEQDQSKIRNGLDSMKIRRVKGKIGIMQSRSWRAHPTTNHAPTSPPKPSANLGCLLIHFNFSLTVLQPK